MNIQIKELNGPVHTGLCHGFNWPPASGWWDWFPGLVGPWAGYRVSEKD